MLKQSVPEAPHTLEGAHSGAVCNEMQTMGRSLQRTVSDGKEPMPEQGKSLSSPTLKEEGAAETVCGELSATLAPHPQATVGQGAEQIKSKVKSRKKGGAGERCFKNGFYFSLLKLDLIGKKLNFS